MSYSPFSHCSTWSFPHIHMLPARLTVFTNSASHLWPQHSPVLSVSPLTLMYSSLHPNLWSLCTSTCTLCLCPCVCSCDNHAHQFAFCLSDSVPFCLPSPLWLCDSLCDPTSLSLPAPVQSLSVFLLCISVWFLCAPTSLDAHYRPMIPASQHCKYCSFQICS